jgi:uncharacterized protein YeaO (DUF488 family)
MALKLRTYQLGTPRRRGEGLRVGVVRRPPRGVRKADYARLDYYDVWLPLLAPNAELLQWIHAHGADNDAAWQQYARRYRAQMAQTDQRQAIELLARLAEATPIAIGCFCADERRCHRSLLRALIEDAAAAQR